MNAHRFDTFTTSLATRLSRRTAVRGGVGGLMAAALGLTRAGTVQGQASPEARPVTAGPVEVTFVQNASGGTFTPQAGQPGTFTLTLTGETGQVVYIADRPSRASGVVTTADFVDGRAFDPADPPNAALAVQTDAGPDILALELTEPRYQAASGTVTYQARLLSGPPGPRVAAIAARQQDHKLAEQFGAASLFVDNLACQPNDSGCTVDSDCCSNNCEFIPQIAAWVCES